MTVIPLQGFHNKEINHLWLFAIPKFISPLFNTTSSLTSLLMYRAAELTPILDWFEVPHSFGLDSKLIRYWC